MPRFLSGFAYLSTYLRELPVSHYHDFVEGRLECPENTYFTIPQIDENVRDYLIKLRNAPDEIDEEERTIGDKLVLGMLGNHRLQIELKGPEGEVFSFTFNQLSETLQKAYERFSGAHLGPGDDHIVDSRDTPDSDPELPDF